MMKHFRFSVYQCCDVLSISNKVCASSVDCDLIILIPYIHKHSLIYSITSMAIFHCPTTQNLFPETYASFL